MAILQVLSFLFSLGLVSSAAVHPKYVLSQHLLQNYPKDGLMMVPKNNSRINITVNIYSVFGLNENEILEINGWAKVQWRDPRLTWKPSEWNNVESVYLPGKKIWLPDVGIANAKQLDNKDFSTSKGLKVEVRSTGKVNFYAYFLSKTPCPIITDKFPFDQQICPIIFGTIYSRSSEFSIEIYKVTIPPLLKKNPIGQWRPIDAKVKESFVSGGKRAIDVFQLVRVNLILDRKPTYHIVLVIVPYCLICSVGAILFVIKEPADRFAVSLTILLAMSVYVMIVSQGAPKSMSSLSAMDKFLLIQMALLVFLTFIVVLGPLVFPPHGRKSKKKDDHNIEDEEEFLAARKVSGRRCPGWCRKYDYVCLILYVLGSIGNGAVCLLIFPQFIPELA